MNFSNAGIDYGLGMSNIDLASGIRYGVISANSVGDVWGEMEHIYIERCPNCGDSENLAEIGFEENFSHICNGCGEKLKEEDLTNDDPDSIIYDKDGLLVEYLADAGVFMVFKSDYTVEAKFCSPCFPGAGDLDNQIEGGATTYCLPLDWLSDWEEPPYKKEHMSLFNGPM